jgi:hypothetical protein
VRRAVPARLARAVRRPVEAAVTIGAYVLGSIRQQLQRGRERRPSRRGPACLAASKRGLRFRSCEPERSSHVRGDIRLGTPPVPSDATAVAASISVHCLRLPRTRPRHGTGRPVAHAPWSQSARNRTGVRARWVLGCQGDMGRRLAGVDDGDCGHRPVAEIQRQTWMSDTTRCPCGTRTLANTSQKPAGAARRGPVPARTRQGQRSYHRAAAPPALPVKLPCGNTLSSQREHVRRAVGTDNLVTF